MAEILISSILIGLIFAPLGCFVLWKRYIYFSDGLSHTSMLTTAISIIAGLPIVYAAIANTLLFIWIVSQVGLRTDNNAAIGVASSIMIALGLILSHNFHNKFNLDHLLFGDIMTTDYQDIFILLIILASSSLFIFLQHQNLLLSIMSRDIAFSRGIKVKRLELIFLVILSFAISTTIKIVGVLLVNSIILIPAIIARMMSKTPHQMIFYSILIAQIMNFGGITLSIFVDWPFAASIITCGGTIYLLVLGVAKLRT